MRFRNLHFRLSLALVAFTQFCADLRADPVVLNPSVSGITDGMSGIMYVDPVVGFDFTPIKALQIDYLGVYDDDSDGLRGPHTVGLFIRQTGQMLATATLNNASFVENTFRWERVPRVTLQPGVVYNIAAFNWAEDKILANWAANFSLTPDITGVQGYLEGPTTGLHMPTRQGGPTSVFIGPAFGTAVPEPEIAELIAICFLAVLALRSLLKNSADPAIHFTAGGRTDFVAPPSQIAADMLSRSASSLHPPRSQTEQP